MPQIAFSTLGCPDWTWFDLLQYGPQFGYDGVEIRLLARDVNLLRVADLSSHNLAQRRRELGDAGFAVCGLASSVRFDFSEQREIDEQVAIGRAYVDLAQELGASFVRVFGDVLPTGATELERRSAVARIAQGLDGLGRYAQQAAVDVLLETHGDFSAAHHVRDVMRLTQCPAVGVLWDTHHPWRFCNEPLSETFREIGRWVRHTHWKDSVVGGSRASSAPSEEAGRTASQLMSGHRHADYVLFGAGEFPARECLQLLISAGYEGWFSLEWEKMWHPEIEDPETALPLFPRQMRDLHASVAADVSNGERPRK